MQRWRYMGFAVVALSALVMPGRLSAQDAKQKGAAPPPRPRRPPHRPPSAEGAAPAAEAKKAAAPAAPAVAPAAPLPAQKEFHYFAFLSDPAYDIWEQIALWVVLRIAVAGLVYAGMLVGQVIGADEGTERMREVGAAIRQGANAYLAPAVQGDRPAGVRAHRRSSGSRPRRPEQVAIGRAGGVLHRGDVLVAGRLRRHEPGGAGQPARRRRRADQLRRGACSSATAPARSPACSPTAWACWAARSSS